LSEFVVDCSVSVQWYVEEQGFEDSRALLGVGNTFFAPTVSLAEFGNVCWKKVRRGGMERRSAEAALESFARDVVNFVSIGAYIDSALTFALDNALTVYDLLYVALTIQLDRPLVTNDTQLHAALSAVNADLALFPADTPR
jgi:predicted nucleic acid-binding protein